MAVVCTVCSKHFFSFCLSFAKVHSLRCIFSKVHKILTIIIIVSHNMCCEMSDDVITWVKILANQVSFFPHLDIRHLMTMIRLPFWNTYFYNSRTMTKKLVQRRIRRSNLIITLENRVSNIWNRPTWISTSSPIFILIFQFSDFV